MATWSCPGTMAFPYCFTGYTFCNGHTRRSDFSLYITLHGFGSIDLQFLQFPSALALDSTYRLAPLRILSGHIQSCFDPDADCRSTNFSATHPTIDGESAIRHSLGHGILW